jgi:hypothetical protein
VNLLTNSQPQQSPNTNLDPEISHESTLSFRQQPQVFPSTILTPQSYQSSDARDSPSAHRSNTTHSPSGSHYLEQEHTADGMEALLDIFRNEVTPNFPFVVIPCAMTAHQLSLSKPFLLKTIIYSSSRRKTPSQPQLSTEILSYISEHLVMEGEKSLELLQGILIYIAWYVNITWTGL